MTDRIIDPRLSPQLIALLEAHEVPEEEGALLWEFEKRGYMLEIYGPDGLLPVNRRWMVVLCQSGSRWTFPGQTARIALALAFQHVVEG